MIGRLVGRELTLKNTTVRLSEMALGPGPHWLEIRTLVLTEGHHEYWLGSTGAFQLTLIWVYREQ